MAKDEEEEEVTSMGKLLEYVADIANSLDSIADALVRISEAVTETEGGNAFIRVVDIGRGE